MWRALVSFFFQEKNANLKNFWGLDPDRGILGDVYVRFFRS